MKSRRGFSLIELLVVMAVIAILATLSIVVMSGILDQAREDATAMTITKVSELLEERISAFDRAANGAVLAAAADDLERSAKATFGLPFTGVEPRLLRKRVAEIIARKVLFRENFPQRFAEMTDVRDVVAGTAGSNGIPDLLEEKLRDPQTGALTLDLSRHRPQTESAELLYFMLTRMPVFGVAPIGIDAFNSGEVRDTDGDGLLEFIDAWEQPLRFYRWPTRLIDVFYSPAEPDPARVIESRVAADLLIRGLPGVNGITRDPLLVDPDDTIGRIGFELLRLNGNNGSPDLSSVYNEATFHTPDVFHTPLVMSAGSDGALGLAEPNDVQPASGVFGNLASPPDVNGDGVVDTADMNLVLDSLTDNITNRNRRAGGSN